MPARDSHRGAGGPMAHQWLGVDKLNICTAVNYITPNTPILPNSNIMHHTNFSPSLVNQSIGKDRQGGLTLHRRHLEDKKT
eukprot:scaffold65180_cov63-Attheya_sp.AAC.1